MGASVVAQGFLLFFLCGPLSHIHLRINISQRVKVITSTNTWYHRSAKEHIPLKFLLYSSFKTQRRNDCTKSGSRVLTFPYSTNNQVTVVGRNQSGHSFDSTAGPCFFNSFIWVLGFEPMGNSPPVGKFSGGELNTP